MVVASGLSINSNTGLVDVSASTPGSYTVTYTTNGACPNSSSVSVEVVVCSTPPANDECSDAISLIQSAVCTPTQGTLADATQSLAPCSGGVVANDVWYSFVATATSAVIDFEGSADIDGVMQIYELGCTIANPVVCVDNGFSVGIPETAQLDGLNIGDTYHIRVYHYTATGDVSVNPTFDICVYELPPAPANDSVSYTHLTLPTTPYV